MKIKTILKTTVALLAMGMFAACDDFFEPENGTVKYGDDYMNENSELYAGFVGVVTKMQAVGDKAIYLLETRGDLLETTGNSPELYAIYNYEPDLTGNSYADPAAYYDLIIACNDYLEKAREFKEKRPTAIDEDHYKGLISTMLRLKVWTYLTLGKIYGQAVWFDDPMWELQDYTQYPLKDLDGIISNCVELLRTGFDGIDGTHNMSWTEWITSSNDDTVSSGDFTYWDVMVPPYWVLAAELALWQDRFQDVVDLILPPMNAEFEAAARNAGQIKYMRNGAYASTNMYPRTFDSSSNSFSLNPPSHATVSVIRYNYLKNQTNSMVKHFRADNYMLKPSEVAMARYTDPDFNPNNGTDKRFDNFFRDLGYGEWVFSKFRKASGSVFRDDNFIYTYHSVELYFMLIEALNQLGRSDEVNALMNNGLGTAFATGTVTWDGFSQYWAKDTPSGNRDFPDAGVRGTVGAPAREMKTSDTRENRLHNDMELLKEIIIEQAGEGKIYPAMIRIAKRYNDYNIIADFVCPKYEVVGKEGEIRSKILNGGYFVPWDLDSTSSSH